MDQSILLVVEDDALVLLVAQDALEAGGYSVVVACTGAEAVHQLDNSDVQFAGLITDVNLGRGVNGWDVARHAREMRPALPVIYTTAHAADDWPAHGVPNSLLIQKPYAPAQLLTAISTAITASNSH